MLQMNPRVVILASNPKQHLAIGPSLAMAPFQGSEMLCHLILGAPSLLMLLNIVDKVEMVMKPDRLLCLYVFISFFGPRTVHNVQ